MNVSFTRARAKLVIFGSRKTLQTTPLLKEFFTLMEGKGWTLPLAPSADTEHTLLFSAACKSPGKRTADHATPQEPDTPTKENVAGSRPVKKIRVRAEEGLLKGRPILHDLVNDTL